MNNYIVGDRAHLRAKFTDPDTQQAIDAGTVTIKIRKPDNSTITQTANADTTIGSYYYDQPLDQPGTWTYGFSSVGGRQANAEKSFFVQPSAFS